MNAGHRRDGAYIVNPTSQRGNPFSVFCKFQLDSGVAWTVIQRRENELNFNRSWSEYETGFGLFNGSFWLGLQKIYALTSGRGKKARLHIDVISKKGTSQARGFAEYGEFSVGNSSEKYQLHVGDFQSSSTIDDDIGNGPKSINEMKFTTFDQDNDIANVENCAVTYGGGWWFSNCFAAFLNGIYPPKDHVVTDCTSYQSYAKYLSWTSINNCYGDVIFSEMLIRLD